MSDQTTALSPRHERFVAEYLKDGNATQAYIRAGYSPRGAQPSASRLLRDPRIEAAVAAGRQRMAQALEVDVQRIVQEYAKMAYANVADYVSTDSEGRLRVDLEKASLAQQAGIVELRIINHRKPERQQVTLKLGKLQALAVLTKQLGGLAVKPAPGLTAEDRQAYEERCAGLERLLDHREREQRRLQRELDEIRTKTDVEIPPSTEAAPPPEQPIARKQPAVMGGMPVKEEEPALPQGTWIKRKPGEHIQVGPTSAEALWAMDSDGFEEPFFSEECEANIREIEDWIRAE